MRSSSMLRAVSTLLVQRLRQGFGHGFFDDTARSAGADASELTTTHA